MGDLRLVVAAEEWTGERLELALPYGLVAICYLDAANPRQLAPDVKLAIKDGHTTVATTVGEKHNNGRAQR